MIKNDVKSENLLEMEKIEKSSLTKLNSNSASDSF